MAWMYVLGAGVVEVMWVLGLKHSEGYLMWGVTIALIVASFYLILKATESLPVGTVYAVFTGMGTLGIVLVDVFVFGTPISWMKVLFLCFIVAGVVGIKLITGSSDAGADKERGMAAKEVAVAEGEVISEAERSEV